jgi:hypothetical protein
VRPLELEELLLLGRLTLLLLPLELGRPELDEELLLLLGRTLLDEELELPLLLLPLGRTELDVEPLVLPLGRTELDEEPLLLPLELGRTVAEVELELAFELELPLVLFGRTVAFVLEELLPPLLPPLLLLALLELMLPGVPTTCG